MTDSGAPQVRLRSRTSSIGIHGIALGIWCVMLAVDSPQLILLAFSLLSLTYLAVHNDRRLTHPVAVFTLFFYPYSTWFVYYALLKGGYSANLLAETLKLEFLGLWAFTVASDTVAALMSLRKTRLPQARPVNHAARLSVFLPVAGSVAVIGLSLLDAMGSGATAKRELIERGSELGALSGIASVTLTAGAVLIAISLLRDRGVRALFVHPLLVVLFIAMLGSLVILGERDQVFRFGFCMLVVYFVHKGNATIGIMLLMLVGVTVMLPFSQAAKGLLLPGGGLGSSFSANDIFLGEFLGAGRNIYMLLYYGVEHSYSFLFNDLVRGLLPLSGEWLLSAGNWYNTVYRVNNDFTSNSGWGFSLVAEGYLVGGYLGVVIVLALVGAFAQALYALRTRSDYFMAFYVLALPAIVYCIRADIANVLAQTIKIGGTAVALYWLAHLVLIAPKPEPLPAKEGVPAE